MEKRTNSQEMIICNDCKGSGEVIEHRQLHDSKEYKCTVCNGEGRLLKQVTVITRPLTDNDKLYFRKVLNF
jgi:DnaJ-class molecular chaperone